MTNTKMEISNRPQKGMADWFPEEYTIRKYIFDTWRKVCKSFGYEEYLAPLLEDANMYRAKSGGDVGGKELTIVTDRAGRELAIRPEMTPSVTRMISQIYTSNPKPIRYFSIANFYRNQKPQRGRNREFWQLNYDMFGSNDIEGDIEVVQMGIEIMLAFNPPKGSFIAAISNRKMVDYILDQEVKVNDEQKIKVVRMLDKWGKLEKEDFLEMLKDFGLREEQISSLITFIESENKEELLKNFPKIKGNEGYIDLEKTIDTLISLGYGDWIKFKSSVVRGLDYYTGMVFEMFDNNPRNIRSMFGGGRYDGLAGIFGSETFPAVGCAPGDETTKLFLEDWGLIEKIREEVKETIYYLPLLSEDLRVDTYKLAIELRRKGMNIVNGLEMQTVGKALRYANQRVFDKILLYGTDEKAQNTITVKDLNTGEQKSLKIEDIT